MMTLITLVALVALAGVVVLFSVLRNPPCVWSVNVNPTLHPGVPARMGRDSTASWTRNTAWQGSRAVR